MDCKNCVCYDSLSKLKNIKNDRRICTNCDVLNEYRELVHAHKIDPSIDCARFNRVTGRHQDKKKRRVSNASNNKGNSNRSLSKSTKKPKYKSK